MDCSLSGSSACGILQARILKWVAISFLQGIFPTQGLNLCSLVAQMVKRLPTMQETWVQSLGQKDPLEKGNGNPLQYSCLEIPMDREAC